MRGNHNSAPCRDPARSENDRMEHIKHGFEAKKDSLSLPMVSKVFDNGAMVEMVYDSVRKSTAFAVWKDDAWQIAAEYKSESHARLRPYASHNSLIAHEIVLFPSEPEEYGSKESLLQDIQSYIHRYLDVSPTFERIASYYVLLSWVYDRFNELPYLRLRGDFGSGKTRFLLTVGSLCYKPIFASGASTISPLFRMLDTFRGTLVIDEGDFRVSDEKAEFTKILNNGNARGFPVFRNQATPTKEFSPRAYQVFGPKIVATRDYFQDRALESRFLTEEMGTRPLRRDVPITLPPSYRTEALALRNRLLLYRFRHYRATLSDGVVPHAIEPRLKQILRPLVALADDSTRTLLIDLMTERQRELVSERGADMEAQLLTVIRDLMVTSEGISVQDIARRFGEQYQDDYRRPITPKWVGMMLRRRLQIKPHKSSGVYVLGRALVPFLERLYQKYGITESLRLQEDEKAV